MAGSAFTYHQNASTHGPPTSSAVLVNLGASLFVGSTCETSKKRDQLGSCCDIVNRSRTGRVTTSHTANQISGLPNAIAKPLHCNCTLFWTLDMPKVLNI
jgi:hypothetical protein